MDTNTGESPGHQSQSQQLGNSPSEEEMGHWTPTGIEPTNYDDDDDDDDDDPQQSKSALVSFSFESYMQCIVWNSVNCHSFYMSIVQAIGVFAGRLCLAELFSYLMLV